MSRKKSKRGKSEKRKEKSSGETVKLNEVTIDLFSETCPRCKGVALMIEAALSSFDLEGYELYRCTSCNYTYMRVRGEIKEVAWK